MTCQYLTLNKSSKNRITFEITPQTTESVDYTNLQGIFRIKSAIEDTTAPLFETLVVIATTSSTYTAGYVDIDLTALTTLSGYYFYEFEFNDASGINTAPSTTQVFYPCEPTKLLIQTRLDN
jgi:hypothetical protein